eukprot:m.197163 g.197163  ORF g.197163 m.197163 type:complete len:461 (-) comp32650_c0_seq1:84-1466(-)
MESFELNTDIRPLLSDEESSSRSSSQTDLSISTGPNTHRSVSPKGIDAVGVGQASTFSSTVNLLNTIVGAGTLGLPHALSESGLGVGLLLVVVAGTFSSFGLHMLTVAQETVGIKPSSFYIVGKASLPAFTKLVDIAVAIKCFGVATSYLIVIGDLMPDVMRQMGSPVTDRHIWVLIGFLMTAPLAFLKTLDALKVTSSVALGLVVAVTFLVVLYACGIDGLDPCEVSSSNETQHECFPKLHGSTSMFRTMRVFTIYIFSFTCQQNIFAVWSELKNGSVRAVDKVIGASIGSAACIYVSIALAGYITFGANVEADILQSYPKTAIVSIARMSISILVAFSYPLQAHPARQCLLSLYSSCSGNVDAEGTPHPASNYLFYGITVAFTLLSFLLAMVLTDLGIVLELVGATGSTIVSYILPGAIYWKLHPEPHWLKTMAIVQFSVGCCIIPVALGFIIYTAST